METATTPSKGMAWKTSKGFPFQIPTPLKGGWGYLGLGTSPQTRKMDSMTSNSSHDSHLLLPIVIDSREQRPFAFRGRPVAVQVGTLEAGDYSVRGFERRIAVERKSLADLVMCLGRERERFERELVRLRGWGVAAVVVEEPVIALRTGRYMSGLDPAAAWQSVVALSSRFRVPFFWCAGREDAESVTFDILRHYARDRWRELRALRGTSKQA